MKVLYIGYHKENSDWGQITRNNILSLDKAGVDVVCRGIKVQSSIPSQGRIFELENKKADDCDVCIQHVFPDSIVGSSKFKKNIAIVSNTFLNIRHSSTIEHLQQVDEVWVPNQDYSDNIGDLVSTKVVPASCNLEKFKQRYQPIDIPYARNKFRLYCFVDSSDSHSLDSILSSFHSEFDYTDRAVLIIVVTNPSDQAREAVNRAAANVKETLRLNKDAKDYLKEVIITDNNLSEDHLMAAHQYGHCFIDLKNSPSATHGVDALGLGSRVILTNISASKDLLKVTPEDQGYPVGFCIKSNKTTSDSILQMNCGHDFTCLSDDRDLKNSMRSAYNDWEKNPVAFENSAKSTGFSVCESLSFESVGSIMKDILND